MSGHQLILIRHAKSDYPLGVADHDRPLSERGRRDAPVLGRWLDEHLSWSGEAAPMVMVSTAARAQETWLLAAANLSAGWAQCERVDESRIYEATPRTLREVIGHLPEQVDTAIMVGHNPGLIDFVFDNCHDGPRYAEATVKFPTCSLALLRSEGEWSDVLTTSPSFTVLEFVVPRG